MADTATMADTAAKDTTAASDSTFAKPLAAALAGVNINEAGGGPAADRPVPPKKIMGLTRRMSFTGRPIDIVRDACSMMRNELVSLFGRWVRGGGRVAAGADRVAATVLLQLQ